MKPSIAAIVAVATLSAGPAAAAETCTADPDFAIAAHGGEFTDRLPGADRLKVMKFALTKARDALDDGASAIDVVEQVVKTFEDSGVFNAGKGAIADAAGLVETDAGIMDGNGLKAGSVASMTRLKNPIVGARLVLKADRHVLLVGERGQAYVEKLGAETVPADYFVNTRNVTRRAVPMHDTRPRPEHGTVGAVALDRCGHLAAATSTGGYDAKVPGRVGDSPLVGDGVYAADGVAALSGTGWGEYYIRYNIAKDVADRMRYGGKSLGAAMHHDLFDVLKPLHADGGLIGVDAHGDVEMQFNDLGMFRGYATDAEAPVVAQYGGPTHSKPRAAK